MGRRPICDESIGLKKGPWTSEEDQKLRTYIETHGHQGWTWRALPKNAGLNRCGKSCRLRWINSSPDINRGNFSKDEEQTILHLQSILGNKWSFIASYLPGRTDNQIKNFWYTRLRKKRKYWMNFDQQYNDHAIRLQMEALELTELLYAGEQLFNPTVDAPPSVSVSSYCQSLGEQPTALDILSSTGSFPITENLESQPLVQQHGQNQYLWISQLCVEQQVDNILPSNNVSSAARSLSCLPDNLEDFFLLEF